MEIHLDLVGGLAGDMFIAALLDAWPAHEARVRQAIDATRGSCGVSCALVRHADHMLHGSRFEVFASAATATVADVVGRDSCALEGGADRGRGPTPCAANLPVIGGCRGACAWRTHRFG